MLNAPCLHIVKGMIHLTCRPQDLTLSSPSPRAATESAGPPFFPPELPPTLGPFSAATDHFRHSWPSKVLGEEEGAGSLELRAQPWPPCPQPCPPGARGHLLLQPREGSWATFSWGPEQGANLGVAFDLTTILSPGENTHMCTHTCTPTHTHTMCPQNPGLTLKSSCVNWVC